MSKRAFDFELERHFPGLAFREQKFPSEKKVKKSFNLYVSAIQLNLKLLCQMPLAVINVLSMVDVVEAVGAVMMKLKHSMDMKCLAQQARAMMVIPASLWAVVDRSNDAVVAKQSHSMIALGVRTKTMKATAVALDLMTTLVKNP